MTKTISWADFKIELNSHLKNALDKLQFDMNELKPEAAEMARILSNTILRGGKRGRPYLFYLAYTGYGGTYKNFPWNIAVATELFHQHLLIHDDVIDHDLTRSGGANVTGQYLEKFQKVRLDGEIPRSTAEAMAILAGDLCLSIVMNQLTIQDNLPPSIKLELFNILHDVMQKEMAGQQADILFSLQPLSDISKSDIRRMYTFKTSAYTFELPMIWAQIVTDKAIDQNVILFAKLAGIIFQTHDDLQNLLSSEKILGKPTGNDIRENKKTLPIAIAREVSSELDWQHIRDMLGQPISATQLEEIQNLLKQSGTISTIEDVIEADLKMAFKHLANTSLSIEIKQAIKILMRKLLLANK